MRTSFSFSLSREVITRERARRGCPSGGLVLQRRLRLRCDRAERGRVADGEVGEDLAVELDLGRLAARDELVVREVVRHARPR